MGFERAAARDDVRSARPSCVCAVCANLPLRRGSLQAPALPPREAGREPARRRRRRRAFISWMHWKGRRVRQLAGKWRLSTRARPCAHTSWRRQICLSQLEQGAARLSQHVHHKGHESFTARRTCAVMAVYSRVPPAGQLCARRGAPGAPAGSRLAREGTSRYLAAVVAVATAPEGKHAGAVASQISCTCIAKVAGLQSGVASPSAKRFCCSPLIVPEQHAAQRLPQR